MTTASKATAKSKAALDALTDDVLDLDRERAVRREARAQAGGSPDGMPVRFGGEIIATLPAELPIDVFGPLKDLDVDLALLIQQAVRISAGDDEQATRDATGLVVDLLVAHPSLPSDLVDAVRQMGVALLGPDGLDKFMAARPTREDFGAFAKGLFRHYGVSLGEALGSPASPETGGATSNPTSNATTDSTPEGSTSPQELPASSEPAA